MNTRLTIIALIALAGIAAVIIRTPLPHDAPVVDTFGDCVAAGYSGAESYPRQCLMPNGQKFVEAVQTGANYENAVPGDVSVELPYPGAVVGKAFSVIGKARGSWFSEAAFPVELQTPDGILLATGVAHAQGDWMTDAPVPFRADMQAPAEYIGPAILMLWKANPSDEPQNDAVLTIPITVEY